MRAKLLHHSSRAFLLVAALVCVLSVSPGRLSVVQARAPGAGPACAAALGAYVVGLPPLAVPGTTPRSGAPAIPYPYYGGLRGTILLSGAPACHTNPAGSFNVHLEYQASSGAGSSKQHGSSGAAGAYPVLPLSATSVLTATGTFSPDAAHPNDPTYVSVSATITYGRATYPCSACFAPRNGASIVCPEAGCGPVHLIVARVVTFTNITGYLHLQSGSPATLALAFLPPPDMAVATTAAMAVQPLILSGRRLGS
ncbi:MAG TPA: hypothetical protein VHB98_07455 [Chloroflexota bacterium]|nr:hypothetical protein [Chloroflexota bacterium]